VSLLAALAPAVTWIKVEKPTFDLVGLVLGSFRMAGALVLLALALGTALGVALLWRHRRAEATSLEPLSLRIDGHRGA
jgi:hypothetical protein